MTKRARVIILGSGPAGCTAAIYASRANLQPLLITGLESGGQLMTTTDVDNWPADADGVQGPQLMERFLKHAARFGGEIISDEIIAADLSSSPFFLKGEGGGEYAADALIIAAGARAKYLGLPSEKKYLGRGVSACATCDGFFHRGKPVAVVGGGNTAAEETLYLSGIAASTTLIHRRDSLRAEAALADRVMERVRSGKVGILFSHIVEEIKGDEGGVTSVLARNLKTDEIREIPAHGFFVAVGHIPNTAIFNGQLEMGGGYIMTRAGRNGFATATNKAGVFAAGDVQDSVYRQAVTAAASGCMAALDAQRYLEESGG